MTKSGKPRKWISKAIEALDPEEDYAEIMRLSVTYRSNDTFMDLIYSITFPNFVVPNRGALAVLREGKGKVFRHAEKRMDDTARHILIWNEFGPRHKYTLRSVESLNILHEHWSKKYPGSFKHNEDYIYTLCYEATLFHRLMERVGLHGLSEKEKLASWKFYSELCKLFRNAETGKSLKDFPNDFGGCLSFVEQYEACKRPPNAYASAIDDTLIRAFAKRHLPAALRPFGRALVLALLPEGTVRGLGLTAPNILIRKFCRTAFAVYLLIGLKLLPDPVRSHPEIIREQTGESVEQYVQAVTGGTRTQPGIHAAA